jgi:Bacterial regulatory proteins, luxR family
VLCDGEDETERTVQHDRGEQREAARGMASPNWICGWNIPRRPPGVPFGYLARLQRAFAAGPRARSRPLRHHWPLTGRELEVLRMLAAGRPDQAIARELVVTLDTVKSTWATSWASSARPTASSPWPGLAY